MYYIGKGFGKRAWSRQHRIKPPTNINLIVILHDDLDESDALQIEKNLILKYGRIDLGTGTLRNLTEGGEGASGRKWTIEERQRRESLLAARIASGLGHYNKGRKRSADEIANQKETVAKKLADPNFVHHMVGKKLSEESITKRQLTRELNQLDPNYVHGNKGRKLTQEQLDARLLMYENRKLEGNFVSPLKGKPGKPSTEEDKKLKSLAWKNKIANGYVRPRQSEECKAKRRATNAMKHEMRESL
jgi:hypothetical protein